MGWNKVKSIRKVEAANPNPEVFDNTMREVKFVAVTSEKKEVELVPGGRKISLSWKNRTDYINLLYKHALHEYDTQIDAIHKGLSFVVPTHLLSLFTWQEVSALVCGRGMSLQDVDLLEEMTNYSGGHGKNTTTIKLFWKMMREKFTEEDRAAFLAFVWGRSRLPTSKQNFSERFTISGHSRSRSNPDAWFPIAHTCAFSVEMPKYTNIESMTEKIKWAMYNCTTTDADGSVARGATVVGLERQSSSEEGPSMW